MQEKSAVTWIHLSDRHFGQEDPEIPGALATELLLEDIDNRETLSPDLATIDFLFFTGDLVWNGATAEYADAYEKFLSPIITTLGIRDDRVYLVPGNHEVHRKEDSDLRKGLRDRLLAGEPVGLTELEEIWRDKEDRGIVLRVFQPYLGFLRDHLPHIAGDTGGFVAARQVSDMEVEIVGVNTAWVARGGKEEKGKLSIGLPLLMDLLGQRSKGADLRILLMHHPIEWLRGCDEEHQHCLRELTKRVDLILHGHLHEKQYVPYTSSGATWKLEVIPAGAVYSDDELERFYYSYGVLDPDFSGVDVYLREYRSESGEFAPYSESPIKVQLPRKDRALVEGSAQHERYEAPSVPDEVAHAALAAYARAHLQRMAEKSGGVAYAQLSRVTEERYTYVHDELLFSGKATYLRLERYGVLPRVGSAALEHLVPEHLHRREEPVDISAIIGGEILSGRQQDCLRVAGYLELVSTELLERVVSAWRGESHEECRQAIRELIEMELVEETEERFPFTGQAVSCLDVQEHVQGWITQPDNLPARDKRAILETCVQLLGTDGLEAARLLLILAFRADELPSELVGRVADFLTCESPEHMHAAHYFSALAFVRKTAELVRLAPDAVAQTIVSQGWAYGKVLLVYALAARREGEPLLSKQCAQKALSLLSASLEQEDQAATRARIFHNLGGAYEILGEADHAADRYADAADEFVKAVQGVDDPGEKADMWHAVGVIRREKLGDHDGAIEAFREGAVADPEEANLWGGIAIVLEEQAEALEEPGEDATEKWGEAVANHLEALERTDDPRVRAGCMGYGGRPAEGEAWGRGRGSGGL